MKMAGEFRVARAREAVWAALNDPAVLKECLPGCQEIERISETEMTATLTVKVGPVKATFTGAVTLSDLDPPNGYTLSGQGQGGAAGFASGEARVVLVEEGGGTVVRYDVDAKVGGKLAQIGSRLIDSTAKKLAGQFFDSLAETLAAAGEAEGGEEEAGGSEDRPPAGNAPAAEVAAPMPTAEPRKGLPTVLWVSAAVVIAAILILVFADVI